VSGQLRARVVEAARTYRLAYIEGDELDAVTAQLMSAVEALEAHEVRIEARRGSSVQYDSGNAAEYRRKARKP